MRLAACASSSGRAALPRVAVLSRAPWSRGTAAREQGSLTVAAGPGEGGGSHRQSPALEAAEGPRT